MYYPRAGCDAGQASSVEKNHIRAAHRRSRYAINQRKANGLLNSRRARSAAKVYAKSTPDKINTMASATAAYRPIVMMRTSILNGSNEMKNTMNLRLPLVSIRLAINRHPVLKGIENGRAT